MRVVLGVLSWVLARGLASSTALLKEKDRVIGRLLGEGICLKWVKLCERTMLSSSTSDLRLSLDWDRLSLEPLRGEPEFARHEPDPERLEPKEPFRPAFRPPLRGLCPSLDPVLGLALDGCCLGMALGLEVEDTEEPDLRSLGVEGEVFLPSFPSKGSWNWGLSSLPSRHAPSSGLAPTPSFLHFREKEEVRRSPLALPGGGVLPSWVETGG